MTNKRIPDLTAATTPLAGTELVPVWDGTTTKQTTVAKILTPAAGNGIDFSAVTPAAGMTSQVLTNYEEGTWTPVRNGFTEVLGGGSITTAGRYTRVGRLVTIQAQITCAGGAVITATSGIGSYLSILPFTPAFLGSGVWVNGSSVAADGGLLVHTNANLYLTTGWTASSSTWYFSATYMT